jgi:hypothetical protein
MQEPTRHASCAALASAFLVSVALSCRQAPAPVAEAEPPSPPLFELHFAPEDSEIAPELGRVLDEGRARIEAFFGEPFAEPVRVDVLGDREAFTAWFPAEWGMGETACWMVATGVADGMAVLSPRVWRTDACEHDPDDATHVRDLLVHELVHVYHARHNPTRDFTGAEGIGWFLEGLATYASGQLDTGHRDRAREAVERGAVPKRLEEAWSGPYRYGVSGTLVEYLDRTFGREALVEMLAFTGEEELLAFVGVTEDELLAAWKDFVGSSR